MNTIKNKILTNFLLLTVLLLFNTVMVSGAQLSFAPEPAQENEVLSLIVDKAEKIAGMKVTLVFDNNLLTFIKAEKTKATSNFMHVVNDKNPGKLIIVMASANGVSGENLSLIRLEFKRNNPSQDKTTKITVTQIQLMDENLKEINGDTPSYIFN